MSGNSRSETPFSDTNADSINESFSDRRRNSSIKTNRTSIIEKRTSVLETVHDEKPLEIKNTEPKPEVSEPNPADNEENWIPKVNRRLSSARKRSLAISEEPLSSKIVIKPWRLNPKWNAKIQRALVSFHHEKSNPVIDNQEHQPQYAMTDDGRK